MDNQHNIVRRAQNGEKAAFKQLYCQTKDKIYFLCLKFLKNEADAMDMVSDTYLTLIEKIDTLQQPQYFETWLKKIAINKCKNYLLKNKEVLFSDNDDMEHYADSFAEISSEFIPESYVIDQEKREAIMNIIDNQLSDVQRSVILMYYYGELSVRTIAEELDCSEGTVKSRLSSARNIINEYIQTKQKKGETLFSTGSIPLLTLLLQEASKEYTLSAEQSTLILQNSLIQYNDKFLIRRNDLADKESLQDTDRKKVPENPVKKGAGNMIKKSIIAKTTALIAGLSIIGIITGICLHNNKEKDSDVFVENTTQTENTVDSSEDKQEQEDISNNEKDKNDTYILPESHIRYIEYSEILDFDTERLNLAKNEIYARHGFIFSTDSIAQYFENCTWYEPSVEASQFTDSVFNTYELTNIRLLEDYEKASTYTYPLEVKNGETVKVDLNGNGILEQVSLSIESNYFEGDYHNNKITVTVNDASKTCYDEGYDLPKLYIVDINTTDKAKELCLEMPGPNDYLSRAFWQYPTDNKLKNIVFEDDLSYAYSELEDPEERLSTNSAYEIQYLGDGRITLCGKYVGITQVFVNLEYQLTEDCTFQFADRIYEAGKDFGYNLNSFYGDDGIILTLKKEFSAYSEPSMSSESFTIQPQKLRIIAVCSGNEEDYRCWTKVELEDQSTGWIYPPSDFFQIEDIFDGTWFSG